MNENQNKVIDWIRSGMIYADGIALLVAISGKSYFSSQFMARENKINHDKLSYEICKAAKVADFSNWRAFISNVQDEPVTEPELHHIGEELSELVESAREIGKTLMNAPDLPLSPSPLLPLTPSPDLPLDPAESIATKPLTEYPAVIRRVIHEYAQLFQERNKMHAVMAEMPESNADAVCTKRAEIFDVIKALSERLEFLFEKKEAFDKKGIVPNEKEVFPAEVKPEPEQPLDEAGMKRQIKNLQSSNSKDQTILDYQAKKRLPEKNPMPAGTKRKKIEMRMAERNAEIEKIEELLLKLSALNAAKK